MLFKVPELNKQLIAVVELAISFGGISIVSEKFHGLNCEHLC